MEYGKGALPLERALSVFIRFSYENNTIVTGQKFRNSNGFSPELKALFEPFFLEKKVQPISPARMASAISFA